MATSLAAPLRPSAPASLHVEILTDTAAFEALRDEWNDLLAQSPAQCVFLTWEWLFSWWETYGRPNALRIVVIRDAGGTLWGIAPLMATRRFVAGLPMPCLEFIGSTHVSSEYLDVIATASCHRAVLDACLDTAFIRLKARFVFFFRLPDHSQTAEALRTGAVNQPALLTLAEDSLYLSLPATFAEYEQRLGPSVRRNVRRYRRHCETELGAVLEDRRNDGLAGLEDVKVLHQIRMQSVGNDGSYASPAFVKFQTLVVERFSARNWVRLYTMALGDRRIGANYCFEYEGILYGYSMGFDPAYRTYSLGSVLLSHVIERTITDGIREFDFLDGGSFKEQWAPARREKQSFVVAWSPLGLRLLTAQQGLRRVALAGVRRVLPQDSLKALQKRWRQRQATTDADTPRDRN